MDGGIAVMSKEIAGLLSVCALACANMLPNPARAQTDTLPVLVPSQTLEPTDTELYSSPGAFPNNLGFGFMMSLDSRNVLVSEPGYQNNDNRGRIAAFERSSNSQWARTGSLDATPPLPGDSFGAEIALSHDYLLATSISGTYLFHKIKGTWTQTDMLPGVRAWATTGQTIEPPYLFSIGDVYRIGPHDKLHKTQTLQGDPVLPSGSFGVADAISDGVLAIGDTADNAEQGAVYIFKEQHGRWTREQKIIASDGASGDAFGYNIALKGDLMAILASGKDLRYQDPACSGSYYTGGAVYIYKRIRGVWTEQQQIQAGCLTFSQPLGISQEWLAIGGGSDDVVYRRSHTGRAEATFIPFGRTGTGSNSAGSLELHGSTLLVGTGNYASLPGAVNVYELRKSAP
jgi:hypothetical protein